MVFEIFLSWYKVPTNYYCFCNCYQMHFDECGRTLSLKGIYLLLSVFMKFKFILVAYIV